MSLERHRATSLATLTALREYRAGEQSRLMAQMLDAMVAEYQERLVDCPESEIDRLRIAAQQLKRLRAALTAEDVSRVALTV